MWGFFLQIVAAILGLWLAQKFVPGVEFLGPFFIFPRSLAQLSSFWGTLVFVGIVLGFLNSFIKPILKILTLPLRIITFNLFSFVLAMAMVWAVDVIFPELIIRGVGPLFWTTIIIWGIGLILRKWLPTSRERGFLKEVS